MDEEAQALTKKYLSEGFMLQLATVSGDQPWAAIVYYAVDEQLNLYWLSKPDARHSREIAINPKVAGSIPLDANPDKPNVGLQLQGTVSKIEDKDEVKSAIKLYTDRFSSGEDFYNDFLGGQDEHKIYKLKPSLIVLLDEHHYKDNPRQEWAL